MEKLKKELKERLIELNKKIFLLQTETPILLKH